MMNFNNINNSIINNTNNNGISKNQTTCKLLQALRMDNQTKEQSPTSSPSIQSIQSIPSMSCSFSSVSSMSSSVPSFPTISLPTTMANIGSLSSTLSINTSAPSISSKKPIKTSDKYSVDYKCDAEVDFLWNCGLWTKAYQDIDTFNKNILTPSIAVIKPNCIENFDKLSKINNIINEHQMTLPTLSNTNSASSSFNSIFSSSPSMSPVDRLDDTMSVASGISLTSNYSYQQSMSRSSSPSPSPFSSLTSIGSFSLKTEKALGSFKDYVFFSNRLTSLLQRKLGKKAVGLEYQALYQFEARKFQYSMLRGNIRIIKDYRCNNNVTDYLIFKFGRGLLNKQLYAICERNDRQPERQPWCCQHIMTLEEMIEYFKINTFNNKSINEFIKNIQIKDEFITKQFNPNMDYNTNINKLIKMLKKGFYDFEKGMENRQNEYMSDYSVSSNSSNYSRRSRNSRNSRKSRKNESKSCKLKNEDKFNYLNAVAHSLGVTRTDLFKLIGNAIEDSFLFARKYPQSVITQGYIDEEHGTLSFELVLEAEIYDRIRGVFYKFAIPIVESINKQTGKLYYEAKNVLTPKMAVDNIRLNCINGELDRHTWIADLHDWNVSYYRRVDYMWFDNITMLRAASQRIRYINNIKKINIQNIQNTLNNTQINQKTIRIPINNRATTTPRRLNKLQSRRSERIILDAAPNATSLKPNIFYFNSVEQETDIESDINYSDDEEDINVNLIGTLKRVSIDASEEKTPQEKHDAFSFRV